MKVLNKTVVSLEVLFEKSDEIVVGGKTLDYCWWGSDNLIPITLETTLSLEFLKDSHLYWEENLPEVWEIIVEKEEAINSTLSDVQGVAGFSFKLIPIEELKNGPEVLYGPRVQIIVYGVY